MVVSSRIDSQKISEDFMKKYKWKIFISLFLLLLIISPFFAHSFAFTGGKGASIIAHTIPKTMRAGTTYPVSITVRNDGTETWSELNQYRLGDVGDSDPLSYGRKMIPNGQTVKPSESITFFFDMTAPIAMGYYTTDWRMLQENVAWFGETLSLEVSVEGFLPSHQATIMSDTIPSIMAKGHLYPVTITVRNDGGDTWSPANLYRLGASGDNDPFAETRQFIPSGQTVSPGQIHKFSFMMQAPAKTGNYITDWAMVHDLVTWFGTTLTKTIEVVDGIRNAAVLSNTIPSVMEVGQSYEVTVTLRNEGNTSWYDNGELPGMYRLGAVGDNDPFALGRHSVLSGKIVNPGEVYTFSFTMTAPGTIGTYITDWSMVQENVTWFGAVLSKTVKVVDSLTTNIYHYDESGRLEYIKLPSGKLIHYQYDYNGNLVKKTLSDK